VEQQIDRDIALRTWTNIRIYRKGKDVGAFDGMNYQKERTERSEGLS